MTSESEHCCRGENLGDALLQQQEVRRRGRARGLRFGFVAIALGILPLPIFVAFFLFRGHAPFPWSPQDAGRNAASFHSLTLRIRKFSSAGPGRLSGRSQKGTQAISKNANPSSSCRVANSKSRKFDKNPDCASCTAAPTASLRAFKNKRISNFGGLPSLDFCECQREAGPTRTQHDASRYSAHVASPTRVFVLEAGSSVRFDPPALILHLASG